MLSAHPAEQRDLAHRQPDRDDHRGEERGHEGDEVGDRQPRRIGELGPVGHEEPLHRGDHVGPAGQRDPKPLEDRPDGRADLLEDRRQLVDECDRRLEQGHAGSQQDDKGDRDRDEVGDRNREPARLDRQVAEDQVDDRLEDVGHQPGHEQDHCRLGELGPQPGPERADQPDQGDHHQPEEEARLARRDDVGDRACRQVHRRQPSRPGKG